MNAEAAMVHSNLSGELLDLELRTRRVIRFTIPPSQDWSDRGGKFKAVVTMQDGEIVAATLFEWRVVKHVCFGHGSNQYGWLPSNRQWKAGRSRRERAGYLPDWP